MGSSFIHLIRTDSNEFFLMAKEVLLPFVFIPMHLLGKVVGFSTSCDPGKMHVIVSIFFRVLSVQDIH